MFYHRYASDVRNFLEECTVLDPRFKDTYFEGDKLSLIYHRLAAAAANGGNVIKAEPGLEPVGSPGSELPHLPQLPDEMEDHIQPGKYNNCQEFTNLIQIYFFILS